jgi:hypothetical protein
MINMMQGDCMVDLLYKILYYINMKNKTGKHYNTENNKGQKKSKESVEKTSAKLRKGQYFLCLKCGEKFWRKPSAIKKGQNKYCCKICYQQSDQNKVKSQSFIEFAKTRKGPLSPTWRGGITPEKTKIRGSLEYKNWRKEVFQRDKYQCQKCQAVSSRNNYIYLHAHHIKSFAFYPELRFELSNGITLCKKCHYKEHTND